MAPPPEYDKEPKAPDKSVTNIPSEDSKALYNLVNDHQANSEVKSTNSTANAEVENNKHVEALDDGQLRALLDEAITYKCPKDREGKSNLFKELLESVEQDEQACEAAARGRRALPHSNSLQELVAALAAEPAPRRAAPRHALPPVSARAIHGGSLPSGVDTSFLLSEEPMRGAEYVATVSCFNPLPLAERRVSASDAHGAHETEPLNRRSKPAFPMTYTARATLEIGSGGAGAGRAVTTTTASNQVRIPRPSEGKQRQPRGPQRAHPHESAPEAAHARDSADREKHWRDSEYIEKWYRGLDVYQVSRAILAGNEHFYCQRSVESARRAGPGPGVNERHVDPGARSPLKTIPKPSIIDMSRFQLTPASNTQHIPVVREQRDNVAATKYSQIQFDRDEVLNKNAFEKMEDEIARKKYREQVGQDLVIPTLSSVNPKNVRSMTIGQSLPLAVNSDKHNQNVNINQATGDKSVKDKKDKHHRKTRNRTDRNANVKVTDKTAPTKPDKTGKSVNPKQTKTHHDSVGKQIKSPSPRNLNSAHAYPRMLSQNETKEEDNTETVITLESRTDKPKMENETELVEMVSLNRSSDTNTSNEFSLFIASQQRLLQAIESSNRSEDNINNEMKENPSNMNKAPEASNDSEVKINNAIKENSNNTNKAPKASKDSEVNINNAIKENSNNTNKAPKASKDSEVNINNAIKENSNNTNKAPKASKDSEVNINNAIKENSNNTNNPPEASKDSEVNINNAMKENPSNMNKAPEAYNNSEVKINNAMKENSNEIELIELKNYHSEMLKTTEDVETKTENMLSMNERSVDEVSMMDCSEDKEEKQSSEVVKIKGAIDFKVSNEKAHPSEVPSNASIFLTLYKRLLASPSNMDNTVLDIKSAAEPKPVLGALESAPPKLPKKKKDKITSRLSRKPHAENSNKKKDIIRNALKKLFFDNITQSDSTKLTGNAGTATTSKEVDSAIPFSCITTPEVVASADAAPAPPDLKIPRNAITSSFATHGVPLPRAGPAFSAAAEEFKKSLDENGNSVQGFSSPQSGSSQQKKQRRKKSSKNETVIKSHHIDGYQGNKDLNELLRFIESAEPERAAKRAPHAAHAPHAPHDDKKKRSAERRKDKAPRASSLDDLSRASPPARPARPARPAPAKPWGEPEPELELTDFQTVTKKRRARRRGEPAPERVERAPHPPPRARSDRSDSNDDMDSVHSLPSLPTRSALPPCAPPAPTPAPAPPPLVSYADIARTRHNIPDLIESCNYYAEGSGAAAPPARPGDADAYPALEARARRPGPPARRGKERAAPPAPDVLADRRPPVVLRDEAQRPRDMDGVTFGFDVNEQLLGPRCDLVPAEPEPEPEPEPAGPAVPVRAAGAKLRYVAPKPPADTHHLHQLVDYVGNAWEDVVRCGGGKVRYFSD